MVVFTLIPGVGGFIIGFGQTVPQWLVYEDPVYFNQGLNLGLLLGTVFSILGFLVAVIRWYRFPELYVVSNNQEDESEQLKVHTTSNTKEIHEIVNEIRKKYTEIDNPSQEIKERLDFFERKYSDFQANKISEQTFKVVAFKTKQFLMENVRN